MKTIKKPTTAINRWINICRYSVQHYQQNNCSQSAAALTYTSLFAVVPLITVMYAVLSINPELQDLAGDLEKMLMAHLVPSSGQDIQRYIHNFSLQARKLTTLGIGFLAITAWLMLKDIEIIFNHIWGHAPKRQRLKSFLMHWAILSCGPLFFAAALFITTYLMSLKIISEQTQIQQAVPYLLQLAPYALTLLSLVLLFRVVPNSTVRLQDALMGATLTTAIFEIARMLFSWLISFSSFELIYGTFAAVPIFLLWIYTSWLIVLGGAVFTHAIAHCSKQSSLQ